MVFLLFFFSSWTRLRGLSRTLLTVWDEEFDMARENERWEECGVVRMARQYSHFLQ